MAVGEQMEHATASAAPEGLQLMRTAGPCTSPPCLVPAAHRILEHGAGKGLGLRTWTGEGAGTGTATREHVPVGRNWRHQSSHATAWPRDVLSWSPWLLQFLRQWHRQLMGIAPPALQLLPRAHFTATPLPSPRSCFLPFFLLGL